MRMFTGDKRRTAACMGCARHFMTRSMLAIMRMNSVDGTMEFDDGQQKGLLAGTEKMKMHLRARMQEAMVERFGTPEEIETLEEYRKAVEEMNDEEILTWRESQYNDRLARRYEEITARRDQDMQLEFEGEMAKIEGRIRMTHGAFCAKCVDEKYGVPKGSSSTADRRHVLQSPCTLR